MKYRVTRSIPKIVAIILVVSLPPSAWAGGICLLHPEPFKLQSDTVRWSVKIASGGECIQGLRWSTIMIDNILITEPPNGAGSLVPLFLKSGLARNRLV